MNNSSRNNIDKTALYSLSYGLFVLTAAENNFSNGCIINTAIQIASNPDRIAISVNKQNHTHDMILHTGRFNVSVLTEEATFDVFQHFGFNSGKDTDKITDYKYKSFSENGIPYINKYTNAFFSCKVVSAIDCGSHTLFTADITESGTLSDKPSVTYSYYFAHIKPKPEVKKTSGKKWVCTICGYVYDDVAEGIPFEELPDDWVCILCKHPKSDFELQE